MKKETNKKVVTKAKAKKPVIAKATDKKVVKPVIAKETDKKAVKPLSVKAKLVSYLRSARVFRDLKTIYSKMEAKTQGAKAGVRGVLNRNFQDASSLFERNAEKHGEYRFRGLKKTEGKAA